MAVSAVLSSCYSLKLGNTDPPKTVIKDELYLTFYAISKRARSGNVPGIVVGFVVNSDACVCNAHFFVFFAVTLTLSCGREKTVRNFDTVGLVMLPDVKAAPPSPVPGQG
jgi:hypothetical protein